MVGWRSGSTVAVYARVHCREPKTGQQKVQISSKTKHFANLGLLFIYDQAGPALLDPGVGPLSCRLTRRGSPPLPTPQVNISCN